MGRTPTKHRTLPPRMRVRERANVRAGVRTYYFYDHGQDPITGKRKETPLGTDLAQALRRWSELHAAQVPAAVAIPPFIELADRYEREVLPQKSDRSQEADRANMRHLRQWFGDVPTLATIRTLHVQQMLDAYRTTPVAANRRRALLSHMMNCARRWGLTDAVNPCTGSEGHDEYRREVYITDAQYQAILAAAAPALADTIKLMYLTGQRLADVLKMRITDVSGGVLTVHQNKSRRGRWVKTGKDTAEHQRIATKTVRIEVTGELKAHIDALRQRAAAAPIVSTLLITSHHYAGKGLGRNNLSKLWAEARARTNLPKELQLRDLRAKAGTDVADINDAQKLLGHKAQSTTEIYRRDVGAVAPTSALRKEKTG